MRVALGVALLLLSLPLSAQWALEGSITGVAQRSDDRTARSARSASADAFVFYTADWGALLAHLEASTTPDTRGLTAAYPEANADAGSALDARGKGRIQLSELSYQSPRWLQQQLVLGLIDPSAWLDRSRITSDENLHFLNASFVNNPTIPFPDYTLGAVWQWREREGAPGLTVIATRARGLLDFERRAHRELFDDEQGGHGGFFGLGSGWRGGNWRLRYGGWLRVDNDIAREDPALSRSRQGAYAVAGYLADAVQLNLRLGFSEGRGEEVRQFLAIAAERPLRFGLVGAGLARSVHAPQSGPRRRQRDDAELFLRLPLRSNGGAHLTPSVQYVQGGTGGDAVIYGLRLHWSVAAQIP